MSGAEAFVRMLDLHDVRDVFGLCGDTSLPLYDAFERLDHGMRHILTRDERSAAYMADGYARVTGKVGVCEGPSGGGATYILPGVIEANESSIPVLAVTTDVSVSGRGRYTLTEIDQDALFRPLTKWNAVLDRAEDVPRTLRAGFRAMTTGRPGAGHIGLPLDVQRGPVDADEVHGDSAFGHFPALPSGPDPKAVEAAADLLDGARCPLIICGGGVVLAGGEAALERLAERLDAIVATSISGQGSLPDGHPLHLGVVGSNGGVAETRDAIAAADVVFFIGCRAGSVTTERWQYPAPGKVRVVHCDSDPAVIGANYPVDVALAGDARLALEALEARLADRPRRDTGAAGRVAAAREAKFAAFEALAASTERPIRPEAVIASLQRTLPDPGVVVADPGTPCPYVSAFWRQERAGRWFISNRAHGALGYAMAASMGAAIGRPEAKTVALMGDGSFGFTAGELETLVRLRVPVSMIVFSNSVFGWIKAGQKANYDSRYFSVDFSRTDHAAVASAFGVKSWRVEDPEALDATLAAAFAHDGPSLVDVIAQPLHEARAPVSEWIA